MKRIGLTQRVDVASSGERRDALDQAWSQLLLRLGFFPVPLANHIPDASAAVADLGISGIILTGGNDIAAVAGARHVAPERDLLESSLLDLCAKKHLPVLGVCRGMEMMNMHGGGALAAVTGHTAVTHGIIKEPACRDFFPDRVNSFHDYGIERSSVAKDYSVLAAAEDGTVEAFRHLHLPHWGMMWHPERLPHDERHDIFLRKVFA